MLHRLSQIPAGESGTDATVRNMVNGVRRSLRHPALRSLALEILNRSAALDRDPRAQADVLYRWVVANIRYIKDPIGVEVVQRPEITVRLRAGDCDDHSTLLAALSMAVGIPAQFKVVGHVTTDFQHVYPELHVNGEWLPADTTARRGVGVVPVRMAAEKIYTITGGQSMPQVISLSTRRPRVKRSTMRLAVRKAVTDTLRSNWQAGLINYADLQSYRRVIDEKNAPFSNVPWLEEPIMGAITDFANMVVASGLRSQKPEGQVSGLEGLDGFLKSVWKAATGVVSSAVNLITGGGKQTVEIKTSPATSAIEPAVSVRTPQVTYQSPVMQEPSPFTYGREYGGAVSDILKNPLTWVAVGGLVLLLVTQRRGR